MQSPPDPPRPEEIIVVMHQAGMDRHGLRIRALITSAYLQGIDPNENIDAVRSRKPPTISATAGLAL